MTLPEDEILRCVCGGELVIRMWAGAPVLAHTVNPTFRSHYARPARSGHEDTRGPALTPRVRSGVPREEASRRGGSHSTGPDRDPLRASRPVPTGGGAPAPPGGRSRPSVPVATPSPVGARRP